MDHLFAAIDLGSNAIKLKVVQVNSGDIEVLEDISEIGRASCRERV